MALKVKTLLRDLKGEVPASAAQYLGGGDPAYEDAVPFAAKALSRDRGIPVSLETEYDATNGVALDDWVETVSRIVRVEYPKDLVRPSHLPSSDIRVEGGRLFLNAVPDQGDIRVRYMKPYTVDEDGTTDIPDGLAEAVVYLSAATMYRRIVSELASTQEDGYDADFVDRKKTRDAYKALEKDYLALYRKTIGISGKSYGVAWIRITLPDVTDPEYRQD